MKKIIFLDRDGVINVDKHYVFKIEDFAFEKRAVEGLILLRDAGFEFIIITNQSRIGRGYYTEEDFWRFNNHVTTELKKNGIKILKTYFSPFHPDGFGKYKKASRCRKPDVGMMEQAEKDFQIDNKHSWMIGDKWADVKCGKNFGIKAILVLTGKAGGNEMHKTEIEYVAKDLIDAAGYIIKS